MRRMMKLTFCDTEATVYIDPAAVTAVAKLGDHKTRIWVAGSDVRFFVSNPCEDVLELLGAEAFVTTPKQVKRAADKARNRSDYVLAAKLTAAIVHIAGQGYQWSSDKEAVAFAKAMFSTGASEIEL